MQKILFRSFLARCVPPPPDFFFRRIVFQKRIFRKIIFFTIFLVSSSARFMRKQRESLSEYSTIYESNGTRSTHVRPFDRFASPITPAYRCKRTFTGALETVSALSRTRPAASRYVSGGADPLKPECTLVRRGEAAITFLPFARVHCTPFTRFLSFNLPGRVLAEPNAEIFGCPPVSRRGKARVKLSRRFFSEVSSDLFDGSPGLIFRNRDLNSICLFAEAKRPLVIEGPEVPQFPKSITP